MTARLHRRSPEVRLQQTTLLSATSHGSAAAPDLLGHLSESGMEPVPGSPQALSKTQSDDFTKWGVLIKEQRILPQ